MASRHLITQSLSSNPSTSSLVTSITRILQSPKPQQLKTQTPENFPPLSQFSSHLNHDLVIQVIKNQTSPYHALLFFNWASSHSPNTTNYYPSFPCYIAMVDLFLSTGLFTSATQFLESHKKLSDFMVGKLIKAYGNCGNIRGAIDWFHRAKMTQNDCIFSCNALLGVLVKANRFTLACAIFDQIVKEGVTKPNVATYTTMISGYCKKGMMENAQKVFVEMSCRPNRFTYNIMVGGFCRKGMMVNARQVVDRMILSKECLPDLLTYTTLIDGYCKSGEMEEALSCLDEMVEQGCEPNVVTYNAIVNGFCLFGKVDEAKRMMTKMRLNGVKDDIITHTSLLKGFGVIGRLDEAFKHLREMISLGIKPDVKAYGVVLHECCQLGKSNEAIALLREMKLRGIDPSVSSFNAVFRVLGEKDELDEAVLLLKRMPDMGRAPNFLSYFTVISSLCKSEGRVEEVEELVQCMLHKGHKPDASLYSCLIKMYCKCGDLDMAIQVLYDALSSGHVISLDSFEEIIEKLFAKGRILEAEHHFNRMSTSCQVMRLDDYKRVLDELICKFQ